MASTFYCGIDLGTTNSTLSVIEIRRRTDDPIKNLKTVPIYQYNKDFNGIDKAQTLLPSYLFFKVGKKEVFTGYYAKHVYSLGDRPMQTVTAVKTRIGSDSSVAVPDYESGIIQEFDMTQCSSLLLRTIWESFKEQYGEEIDNVVITVPAAFNTDEREATMNAALLAGFKKIEILDEPTATLLYFINGGDNALNNLDENVEIEDNDYVLVYDLGGGTLDVCIARIYYDENEQRAIEILSRSPREDFGGNDFDQQLGSYFLYDWERVRESIENRPSDAQNTIISRIVSHAENYKIDLNEKILDKIDNPRMLQRVKSEAVFEVIAGMKVDTSLNKETLDNVFWTLTEPSGPILKPVKRCLGEAGLRPEQISKVVMTGGMTKYYSVRKTLEDFFGDDVRIFEVDAQNSVSKGAAIHCYNSDPKNQWLDKLSIRDRMADDIFVRIKDKFIKIIPREVTTDESGTFNYVIPENRMLKIPIFLYHGLNENDPSSFTPIAGKYIELTQDYKKDDIICLQWRMDKNKIIYISLPGNNETLEINNSGLLSEKEIEKNIVRKYKINPK